MTAGQMIPHQLAAKFGSEYEERWLGATIGSAEENGWFWEAKNKSSRLEEDHMEKI